MKSLLRIILILLVIVFSVNSGFALDTDWDIFFGPKFGIGLSGSMLDISINQVLEESKWENEPSDRRGRLSFIGLASINFISPTNFGIEVEAGYRLGGDRLFDIFSTSHSLKLHYFDISLLGKYWLFGKIISAGLGVSFSVLCDASYDGDRVYNKFNKFDLSGILSFSFNYWATEQKIILSMEIRVLLGMINALSTSGRFNNVGIYVLFGIFYLGKSSGESIPEFRY